MRGKLEYTIQTKRLNGIPQSEKDIFDTEGVEISDEIVAELAAQGKTLTPDFIALCRKEGARYIRSRGSIVFREN